MSQKQELTGFAKFIVTFDKILSLCEEILTDIVFVLMTVLVLVGVVSRFWLHIPMIWTEEASRYCLVFVTFIGISIAARDRSHLGLTLLVDSVPEKAGKVLSFIAKVLGLVIYVTLTYIAFEFMLNVKATPTHSPALSFLPMWVIYIPVVTGLTLACIREVMLMWNDFFAADKPLVSAQEDNWAN